jgi:hypothetical protein
MADTGNDDFRDLYLADFIEANKRVARRRLECLRLQEPQTELLGRGVQSSFDREERPDVIMEAAIGYAGAVGVSCMDEVAALNEKFGELPKKVEDLDTMMTDLDGRYIGLVERQDAYEESTVSSSRRRRRGSTPWSSISNRRRRGSEVWSMDAAINCG